MQKYYILAAFAVILNLSSAKAAVLRDSIGVENVKGKKVILHQVVAKDTYYAIARRYNVSPKVIMSYNDDKYLSLGVIIKVPTDLAFNTPEPSKSKSSAAVPAKTEQAVAGLPENSSLTEHVVEKKENLNMLAQRYGTTVEEIKRLNNLKGINLQIGQVLKVPAKGGQPAEQAPESKPAATNPPAPATVNPGTGTSAGQGTYRRSEPAKKIEENPGRPAAGQPQQDLSVQTNVKDPLIVHTVAGNETMYSIASKYNLTLDQLKAKNNLTTNSLYVGQKLLISGQYGSRPAGTAEHQNEVEPLEGDSAETVKNPSLRLAPSRYGLSQMDEKGTAVWITDPDLDSSKMLVLHRTAPIGTVMKITNPMSNRSTFAKVVGKFTENESTKDVIIVMTKAVADALGALDKRFLCNLTYSGQANEQ